MKKIFLHLMIYFISFQAMAGEMWITTPEITTREKLHRLTEKPSELFKDVDLISMHEAMLSHPVGADQLQELLKQEEDGQTLEVNGKFRDALEKYNKLLANLESVPNVSGIEKITLNAKIRKAELSDLLDEGLSGFFWKDAHAWSPEAPLSHDIFAPPVVSRFHSFDHSPKNQIVLIEAPPDSSVFMDGTRLKWNDGSWSAKVEAGNHQVAVLTPGSLWEVQKILLSPEMETTSLKFEPKAAVGGNCDNPQFTGARFSWNARLVAQFNDGACERVFDGKRWYTARGEPLVSGVTKDFQLEGLSKSTEQPWYKSITKSPWFWIGAGIVVAGATALVIQNQQPGDTVTTPTKR